MKTKPACSTCSDTHRMALEEREVPCTSCPRPCEECRGLYQGVRIGAYCETTPCGCRCHVAVAAPVVTVGTLRALIREALPFVEAAEWGHIYTDGTYCRECSCKVDRCPICSPLNQAGHHDGCAWAALVAKLKAAGGAS